MAYARVKKAADAIPQYPGRTALEAAIRPVVEPLAKHAASSTVMRLLGFWVLWNSFGSVAALVEAGVMSRANVYRCRNDFRSLFGVEVEDFQPEARRQLVTVEVEQYVPAGA